MTLSIQVEEAEHYTHKELKAAFDAVANPEDWRAEINAVVALDKVAVTIVAIEFYTATESIATLLNDGKVRIKSIGYRKGPAGP